MNQLMYHILSCSTLHGQPISEIIISLVLRARCSEKKRTGPMCYISIPDSPAQECRNSWLPLTHDLSRSYTYTRARTWTSVHINDVLQEINFIYGLQIFMAILFYAWETNALSDFLINHAWEQERHAIYILCKQDITEKCRDWSIHL